MSETETNKKSLERISAKMKLLSEYQSKLSQAKTGLEKYQSLQQENKSEKLKSTADQPTSIKSSDDAVRNTVPVRELTTDNQAHTLPSEKYKNKLR